jgi:hypothetical protein
MWADPGWRGLESRQGQKMFLYSTECRPVLGFTQSPTQRVLDFFPRRKSGRVVKMNTRLHLWCRKREYGRGDPLGWPHDIHYSQLALTSRTGGGRSVGVVRSLTKAAEFIFCFFITHLQCRRRDIHSAPPPPKSSWRNVSLFKHSSKFLLKIQNLMNFIFLQRQFVQPWLIWVLFWRISVVQPIACRYTNCANLPLKPYF